MAIAAFIMVSGGTATAHVSMHNSPPPSHITVGNQEFDATVGGLRAYLTAVQTSNPALYLQLAPDVEHLETRGIEAGMTASAGLAAATASLFYAFAGQSTCVLPPVTDPGFAAGSDTWARCSDSNMRHMATFTLVGIGALTAGIVAGWAIAPGRTDFFEVLNKHNRISPVPLQMQLGYDPITGSRYGGAVLTF